MSDRGRPDLRSGPAGDFGRVLWRRARGERVLFDSSQGGPIEGWRPPERKPARRPSLLTATCVPALVAAVAGALAAPLFGGGDDGRTGPAGAAAADLAREASRPGGLPQLAPVVDRGGEPQLASHATGSGAAARPSLPASIEIPDAGVDTPIDAVGATADGLVLPEFGRAGWWEGGPRPGEDGRAVILGHLDSKDGPDVFARVPYLAEGDEIVVRDGTGESHPYEVVGVTRVQKAEFPTDDVYGPATRPVLVLVTCGGPYDPALGHYRDNVLVYARAA
jgi:LPXTG-site transpeptidase (sortase) family protein